LTIPFYNNTANNSGYNIQSLSLTDSSLVKQLIGMFGKKVKISVGPTLTSSSSLFSTYFPSLVKTNGINDGFYVPTQIDMNSNILSSYNLSFKGNSTITWNPDINNPVHTIFIGIIDEGILANQYNPNIKPITSLIYFSEIPDNGTFTITPNLISSLTIGGRASIFIARGNYSMYIDQISGNKILLDALTYSNSGPLAVQE